MTELGRVIGDKGQTELRIIVTFEGGHHYGISRKRTMISYDIGATRIDGELRHKYDVLIRVVAPFVLRCDGDVILSEPDFPILEFALHLKHWLDIGIEADVEFSYDSLEAERAGVIWIRPESANTWRCGSSLAGTASASTYSTSEVRSMARSLVQTVLETVRSLGIEPATLV